MNSLNGLFTKEQDGYCVRFERHLPFPIQTVWDAITNPNKIKIWFAEMKMEFTPGGKITIYFLDEEQTVSYGQVVRIEPPYVFEYSWEEELATWELQPEGDKACVLKLTYSKLPDTYALSVPAGWHDILDQLETVLNGHTTPYPFGSGETSKTRYLKSMYATIICPLFPELKKENDTPPLIMEKEIEASPEKIWRAITEPEMMKQWYFDLPGFKPEVGYTFTFVGGPPEKQYLHLCEVTDVLPGKRLQYSWRYDGFEGNSLVTFEIFPTGNTSLVKLTHEGLETFPAVPDLERENFIMGWTELIGKLLPEFIHKQ